jgi:hypothetical protein
VIVVSSDPPPVTATCELTVDRPRDAHDTLEHLPSEPAPVLADLFDEPAIASAQP